MDFTHHQSWAEFETSVETYYSPFGFQRGITPPTFDATLAEEVLEHLLFIRRQCLG